jgi:hypothetical protein
VSAETLHDALLAGGMRTFVEARERLAIITAQDAASARAIAGGRESVVALASAHGFSHVALEIVAALGSEARASADAALPRD